MQRITPTLAVLLPAAGILVMLLLAAIPGPGVSPGRESPVPQALPDSFRRVSDFVDDNEACFDCHAGAGRTVYTDTATGQVHTVEMDSSDILQRPAYYRSNHKSFPCLDCHSPEFTAYPHPLRALMELPWNCLDCHGHDEDYAHFQFEKIEEEYLQSIHHRVQPDSFSCWKCHDPHTYHISIRTAENLATAIAYDNDICLSCHPPEEQLPVHDWLPNQNLHFTGVRCIECHTQINDSILVAHLVLPADSAVQNCRECHSRNSILTATLYKYRSAENRSKYGFLNAAILNEAYVIGASHNAFLNRLSGVVFALVLGAMAVHIVIRIIRKV